MKEIISIIPMFILAILIFFIADYWLKNNQKLEDKSKTDFGKFMNLKYKGAKIFSIILVVFIILKLIYILMR